VVLDALERHRQNQPSPAAPAATRSDELSSQEVQQRLFDAGLITEIKPPITDLTPYQNRRAVPIQGEPISVTALRERR
jgi:hypothetical protein